MTAYGIAAWWYRDTKQVTAAIPWITGLQETARQRNDLWALGYLQGWPDYWLHEAYGDLRHLATTLEAALAVARTIGDTMLQGYTLNFLGFVYWGVGDLVQAATVHQASLAIHLRSHALHMRVLSRVGLALVASDQGNAAEIIALLEPALADADSIHYQVHGVQQGRLTLAATYQFQGRTAAAAALYQRVIREDEADSDGQVWITAALAGLERTLADPVAFHAACRQLARQRPADDPLPYLQWWLQPADRTPAFASLADSLCSDALDKAPATPWDGASRHAATHLPPGWSWHDPYRDCAFAVDEAGLLLVAANYGRDLWFNNQSAPRLLRAVTGDFAVEAHCQAAGLDQRPAAGGLLLWQDAAHFLRLDWGIDGPRSVSLRGAINNRDLVLGRGCLPDDHQAWLRLERRGEWVRALASSATQQWFLVAETRFAASDPLQIGLFAGGLIQRWFYPGAYAAGSAIRVQGLTVSVTADGARISPKA